MNKSIFKSKTFWMQILATVGMLVPSVETYVSQNVGMIATLWAGLNIVLRMVTKERVILID